ncbi:hypothetical protein [Clostridium cibarium]|uniref:Uncharacterized protein n=1 Tax=Clostridium cibarium TaxID=2762247 RepID=A0ABR8PZ70_9CLOT|nr:hypothetical protein [Clostridium cibarium]MBD7913468.1 hypothetical protein [Clostridium cibarium]
MKNLIKKAFTLLLVALLFTAGFGIEKASAYGGYGTNWNAQITQVTNVRDLGRNVYAIGNTSQITYTGGEYNVDTKNVGIQCKFTNTSGFVAVWVDGSFVGHDDYLLDYKSLGNNNFIKTILVKNLSSGRHRIEIKATQPTGTQVRSDYIYVIV